MPSLLVAGALVLPSARAPVHAQAANPVAPVTDSGRQELPEPVDEGAFPIPPGPERPFGVEDGDRIFVEQFLLKGADDRPAQGVTLDELRKLIEQIRLNGQGLAEVGPDGFTDEERKAVLEFFTRVMQLRDYEDYLFDDYSDLVTQLREDRAERQAGLTIGQLQEVADAVTKYYKDKGFVLAQAFIPAQEVEDGRVTIEVIEGTLGQVVAQGNEGYSQEVLAAPFEDLVDAPVTNAAIESAVLTLRDYPGLVPTALFRPGAEVGTSDLVLSVRREKPYEVSITLDNNGTKATGERRALVDAQWNNPTGAGDAIRAQLLQTWQPKRSDFYKFEYVRPIIPGTRVAASYSKQMFDVGGDDGVRAQAISGVSTEADVGILHDVFRSRFSNVRADVKLRRTNTVRKEFKSVRNQQNLAYLMGTMTFDRIDTEYDGVDVGSIGVLYGLNGWLGSDKDTDVRDLANGQPGTPTPPARSGNNGRRASSKFTILTGQFTRLQAIESDIDVLLRAEGQWSNSLLASELQYSIGGPNNVRAYPVSEFQMDTAIFASMEWFWKAPFFADEDAFSNYKWGDIFKLSFFADYAVGNLNEPQAGDRQAVDVSGMGLAAHFEIPGEFLARLQAAHAISGLPASNNRATQFWFDVNYRF